MDGCLVILTTISHQNKGLENYPTDVQPFWKIRGCFFRGTRYGPFWWKTVVSSETPKNHWR